MYDKKVFFSAAAGVAILICSIFFGINSGRDSQSPEPVETSGFTIAISPDFPGIFRSGTALAGDPLRIFKAQVSEPEQELSDEETGSVLPTVTKDYSSGHVISPYDHVMRSVSEREGADWRLMAAIAYNESRFKAEVVSKRGAKGLMQIMPVVSRQFGVPDEQVMDPEVNITLAVKLINKIESMMKIPDSVHPYDRMALVLASYNCGVGHVADARRLAAKYGSDPNSWDDVSEFLKKKSQPEYYHDGVVRNGRFKGSNQTLAFVDGVLGRYNSYCALAAL